MLKLKPNGSNLSACQKGVWMVLVEENKIERPVAVQFGQFEVDVGEVVLGEHAFFFANLDVAEFS